MNNPEVLFPYSDLSYHPSWRKLAQSELRKNTYFHRTCNTNITIEIDDNNKYNVKLFRWRFQWVIKRKLAVMAWPQYPEHLRFLLKIGIRRLVSLTPECRPPIHMFTY